MAEQEMTGTEAIAAERKRQVEQEGWTAAHDDELTGGALAYAAACYAIGSIETLEGGGQLWPFDSEHWKPSGDRLRDLAKAGALIAAEYDRIARARTVGSDDEDRATFTFGYLLRTANDWDSLCNDIGIDPWCINEGRAMSSDTCSAPVSVWKKHGILPN